MKADRFNVYKEGKIILTCLSSKLVAHETGCNPLHVRIYAMDNKTFHGKNGEYRFEVADLLYAATGEFPKSKESIQQLVMSEEWVKEWNNVRIAAKLIKTGHGRFVTKYIKGKNVKCVEVVG
ncbi:MAG: hypothetical protein QM644_18370 [Mobilitalea sp.]